MAATNKAVKYIRQLDVVSEYISCLYLSYALE